MSEKFNLKNRPKPKETELYPTWKVEEWFEGFEAKMRQIDTIKWFEENVYVDWTWEGMLEKFIRKEILGIE